MFVCVCVCVYVDACVRACDGNWSDWLEAHDGSWDPVEEVFEFDVCIPVGQSEFKFVINDHWG